MPTGFSNDRSSARRPQLRKPPATAWRGSRPQSGSLVIPRERYLAHQIGVGLFEALVPFEHLREPHHAALAADPADLDRLGANRHLRRSYRPLDGVRGDRIEALVAPDRELPVALARIRIKGADELDGRCCTAAGSARATRASARSGHQSTAVRVDQVGARPEAERGNGSAHSRRSSQAAAAPPRAPSGTGPAAAPRAPP